MKNLIFIPTILMLFSCAAYKNTKAQHASYKDRIIITDTNDTLTVKQDSIRFELYTNNYKTEYEKIHTKENIGEIIRAIEYKIVLSPESLKMIEEDGGMAAVLKNILSKENFDRFRYRVPLRLYYIISLKDLSVSDYRMSIYTKVATGSSLLSFSDTEIINLFNYCKKMRFVYTGTQFKDEIVPAGWMFYTKK